MGVRKLRRISTGKREIVDQVKDSLAAYKSDLPIIYRGDFEDDEFNDYCDDLGQDKQGGKDELKFKMGGNKEIPDKYNEDAKEWKEAQMKYEQLNGGARKSDSVKFGFRTFEG